MKVSECMSACVRTVRPAATLSEAATMLWEHDLGAVPVVDADGHLCGMLTDRDISMAALTSGRALHQLVVANHMASTVFAVMAQDALAVAEQRLAMHQLRRLPVVDGEGRLVGIIGLSDLSRSPIPGARIKTLLAKICAPRTQAAPEPVKEVIPAAAPARALSKPKRVTKLARSTVKARAAKAR
jgi:CBS-domain-containing membrane protein